MYRMYIRIFDCWAHVATSFGSRSSPKSRVFSIALSRGLDVTCIFSPHSSAFVLEDGVSVTI